MFASRQPQDELGLSLSKAVTELIASLKQDLVAKAQP